MAKSAIASCTELLGLLEKAVQGTPGSQTLQLDAALLPAAGDLVSYLGLPSLVVHQKDAAKPIVSPGGADACAIIKGTAVLFPKTASDTAPANYDIVIDANLSADDVTLLLKGTPLDLSAWTFGENFPGLPDYIACPKVTLQEKPSFYYTMVVDKPEFRIATEEDANQEAGLSFTGLVNLGKGDLAPIASYFPNSAAVPLSGTIEMRSGTFAAIQLTGTLDSYTIPKIGAGHLAFGTSDATPEPNPQPARSTLLLVGESDIEGFPRFQLTTPILQGKFAWVITGRLENSQDYPLERMLSAMVGFAGGANLPLPSGMDSSGFYLEEVTAALKPGPQPAITMIGFTVSSTKGKSWTAPIFGLTISDLAVQWSVLNPFTKPVLQGSVSGILRFGESEDASRLGIAVSLNGITTTTAPDVTITAALDSKYPVSLADVFRQFTGLDIDLDLKIAMLLFKAQTGPRTLQFATTLEGKWPFPTDLIQFGETNFLFQYTPNSISGSVSVIVTIVNFRFTVSAAYGTGQGWNFSGVLAPGSQNNSLQDFVNALTDKYPQLPANLGAITLRRLNISFNTNSGSFSFDGIVQWPFKLDDDFNLTIEAQLSLSSPGSPKPGLQRKYQGFIRGTLSINAFRFDVIYSFGIEKNTNISFAFNYRSATLTFAYKNDGKNRTLTANLKGVTFGDIVDFLVTLVDPTSNFRLPAPWNVLYDISFDNLTFTANLTTKEVGVFYKIDANLGIVDLKSIGLTYLSKGGRSTVMIALTGRFFDQDYEDQPLSWDLLNDPPPAAPGKGEKLLDLRYVGIGQNVGFRSAKNFTDVQSVIAAMTSDFPRPDNEDENPLNSELLKQLQFAGDGRWLIGADFTVIEAVSLSVVFNDPTLYGLRVALSGEKVKSFSGLDFQILYKKVTDTVGVYHIELTLPQAFRQFNLGAVAVTLPIIVIDIYTNGNFRIDLGFPVGMDFSRSFCVQAGPFIGYGGLYFALLDGSTSERVPAITNGTFSPVIEAGLALSVGLGRTIDKGIFKAGATITVVGIVQGVFGWFNPNDNSAPSALYYWIQGTVALAGKLEGSVDFVIISATVSLSIAASITMTFEAYKAIDVKAVFQVTASASIKILFFRISFSFSMSLEIGFTIGSASMPPWLPDSSQPVPQLLRQQGPWRQNRLTAAALQRAVVAIMGDDSGEFDWSARPVFPQAQVVSLSMLPALTVALPEMTFATAALTSISGTPRLQTVFALFVPTTVPTSARSSEEVRAVENAQAAANPFNLLCAGMLRWALSSYTRNAALGGISPLQQVYATDLEAITAYLGDAEKWQAAFTYKTLGELMEDNYRFHISTPLGPKGIVHPQLGLLQAGAAAPEQSHTVFPMLPPLNVLVDKKKSVNYADYNSVNSAWEQALGNYNAQMKSSANEGAGNPRARAAFRNGPVGTDVDGESLATFLFRDYFAVVTKSAVQSASDLLKSYPYQATGATGGTGESLASIAQQFNSSAVLFRSRRGDTLARIAARFGLQSEEVHLNNPHLLGLSNADTLPEGTQVNVATSVTPVSIATNNADYPLNSIPGYPVHMPIEGVKRQVHAGASGPSESIYTITSSFGIADATTIFTHDSPTNPNAINPQLLQAGSQLWIPQLLLSGFSDLQLAAAFVFTRNLGQVLSGDTPWNEDVRWYQQWILQNNSTLDTALWNVPIVTIDAQGNLVQTGATTYPPRGGGNSPFSQDTPELVAGYMALLQLRPAPYTDAFAAFLAKVTPSGGNFAVQQFQHTVQRGETLAGIAATFGISVVSLVNANLYAQGLMQLLAVLQLPTLNYAIAPGDTLASIAANLDLTLNELVLSVQKAPGILSPYHRTQKELSVPDVPARNTDLLIADLVRFGSFNNVSGIVANFLMHGMRVPQPTAPIVDKTFPTSTPLWGLYEMAGQQFTVPQGFAGPTGFDAVFRQTKTTDWIRFDAPGPTGPTGLKELVVHLGEDYFDNAPAFTLYPQILAGPTALPLYRETLPQYSMQHSIPWQPAAVLAYPGPTASPGMSGQVQPQPAQPSLLIFPPALQDLAIAGATGPRSATRPYQLAAQTTDGSTTSTETPVAHYIWAMAVDFTVQKAPSAASADAAPNSYVVIGADQNGRQDLLRAWTYLENSAQPAGDLYLLFSPSLTSTNSQGLASAVLDPQRTFLLKSNLTTVTTSNQSGLLLDAPLPPLEYSAPIAAVGSFLRLLWEASVTGSGGFYLNYVNKNGGAGLPAELFADSDNTVLTLLYVPWQQARYPQTQRGLYPFNNCVILGDNIDANSSAVYARLANPAPSDLQLVGTAPTGTIGFYLARRDPDYFTPPGATERPDDQTRSLYNLVGFQLAQTDGFNQSNHGLPVGSSDKAIPGASGPTGPGVWWYQQTIPAAQFARQNQTPQSIALPPAGDSPYAGIAGPTGLTGPAALNTAVIELTFNDIYGNRTAVGATAGPVTVPVGYTDEIIGVSVWPGIGTDFVFLHGVANDVQLETQLTLQTNRYLPAASYSFDQAHQSAVADAARYAQIFYQVQQHDLNFSLDTNIGAVLAGPESLKAPLAAFVSKANVFIRSVESLEEHVYTTLQNDTLAAISTTFGVTPAMLVEANGDSKVKPLFAGMIVRPAIVPASPMNSLASLAQNKESTPFPPKCPIVVAAAAMDQWVGGLRVADAATPLTLSTPVAKAVVPQLTVAELAQNNSTAPLTPGTLLCIQPNKTDGKLATDDSLETIAQKYQCAIYAEFADAATNKNIFVGLYPENLTADGIVTPNLNIAIQGVTKNTGTKPTLASVEASFATLGLDTGAFVAQLQTVPGLFVPTAVLSYATFYVPQPHKTTTTTAPPTFAFANIPASAGDIASLALANAAVTNIFVTGTPIYFNYTCYAPQIFDTFNSLTDEFGITLAQFAAFNQTTPCNKGQELRIPNLVVLPSAVQNYGALTPHSIDSLNSIAKIIAPTDVESTVTVIAGINRNLPGIFAEGVTIRVASKPPYSPPPMASMNDAAQALELNFDSFIDAIKATTGLYRTNGVIVTPMPHVPAPGSTSAKPSSLSWNDLAVSFHLDSVEGEPAAVALLNVNRCLEGFVLDGAIIAGPGGSKPLAAGPYDTIDTIIRRFDNEQQLNVTVADLVAANGDSEGLTTVGTLFLLPPNPTTVSVAVKPQIPPQSDNQLSPCESRIVFPVTVSLGMARNQRLVAPDFVASAPVYRSVSAVTPRGWGSASATVGLDNFAEQFETAFAAYKLKCAFSQQSSGIGAETRVLWAVNFGPTGISTLQLDAARPSFYALAPFSTQLLSGDLWVQAYKSGCGLCPKAPKKFDSVDLDNWMQQFLSAVDLVLTLPYAVAAYQLTGSSASSTSSAGAGPASFAEIAQRGVSEALLPAALAGATGCAGCTGGTGALGPVNYESIVSAKLTIAQQLSYDVEPVLTGVGATGNYYTTVAQETLYQQMRVQLSNAYNVNAVVQYPVDVVSPCVLPLNPLGPTAQLPPRLSGNVTPALATVPDTKGEPATLTAANAFCNVSVPYFAKVLAAVQGILLTDAQATYKGQSLTIAFDETLESLAARFVSSISPSNWDQWTAFIEAIANQPLFLAGAALPVVAMARTVGSGAKLEDLAQFFGVDAGSVGQANQSRDDILTVGALLRVPKATPNPYPIQTGDTLLKIAAKLTPPVSVATLAEAINTQRVFNSGVTFAFAQPLPDVTFSTSKINLGRVGSQSGAPPALSFLFSVKHPRQYQNLFLNLKYVINELEYGISNVAGADGYQDSSWLTFLLPFGSGRGLDFGVSTAMPQVQIPIPLRSYPTPPTLLAQSGLPSTSSNDADTPAEQIARGKQWDYRFDFEGLNAAQDTDHVQVTFNAGQSQIAPYAPMPPRTQRIFRALAQFMDAYPALIADLGLLPSLQPGTYDHTAAVALQVFDALVNAVATAMLPTVGDAAVPAQWPELLYQYRAQNQSVDFKLQSLQLTQEKGPSGAMSPLWPEILVQSPSGPTSGVDAGFVPLDFAGATGNVATYTYPVPISTSDRLTQRFHFAQRNVIRNQNAWGGIYLTRNDDLIAGGPLGWGAGGGATGPISPIPTNPSFLYETPLVRFVDPTTPLLIDHTTIDVSGLTGPHASPRSLAAQIEAMLDAILEWGPWSPVHAATHLSILCSYGYTVSQTTGAEEIVATVPVRLVPTIQLQGSQKTVFSLDLAASIQRWPGWATRSPNGFLVFDLKTFSMPVGASAHPNALKPVLEFEALRVPIDAIS